MKFLRWYAPIAIVLVTLNLRPGLLTLGPVLPVIAHALDLTPVALSALTALPVLALGISSAVAVPVGRVVGWAGGMVLAMTLDAAGIWLRSSGGDLNLFCGAALLGIGIGFGNVYVPTLVKSRFAAHIGMAMGGYTMALTCGALLSADLTPILYVQYNDWRPALSVWALPAVVAAVVALPMLIENLRPKQHVAGMGLWSNPVAWAVTVYMGLQSALFYAMAQWLPVLLVGRGESLTDVAPDLQIYYFTQFLASVFAPVVLTKIKRQDLMAAAIVGVVGVSLVAMLYGPRAGIFAWSTVLGTAMGCVFAVALTLQVIRARSTENAARLASMAQAAGYIIASIGPLVLGLVSHWPDSRLASMAWFLILVVVTMIAGMLAGRPRFVDDHQTGVVPVPAN